MKILNVLASDGTIKREKFQSDTIRINTKLAELALVLLKKSTEDDSELLHQSLARIKSVVSSLNRSRLVSHYELYIQANLLALLAKHCQSHGEHESASVIAVQAINILKQIQKYSSSSLTPVISNIIEDCEKIVNPADQKDEAMVTFG